MLNSTIREVGVTYVRFVKWPQVQDDFVGLPRFVVAFGSLGQKLIRWKINLSHAQQRLNTGSKRLILWPFFHRFEREMREELINQFKSILVLF